MKIGFFDSGLGGLFMLRAVAGQLPRYDYLFLGDTKNLPYGEKSQTQIFEYLKKAAEYLFTHDCQLIIVACNTVSSEALRKFQREYLPTSRYQNRRVLGVIRPTAEIAAKFTSLGIIGTRRTIESGAYRIELHKANPNIKIYSKATPRLSLLIERGQPVSQALRQDLKYFKDKKIEALVLACTHYGLVKAEVKKIIGPKVKVISQEEFLPAKLADYLQRHGEIRRKLSRNGRIKLEVSRLEPNYPKLAREWFGKNVKLQLANFNGTKK